MTKLRGPASRRELVPRTALVERLSREPSKLVLVAAPAGWGKTTLLAAWARHEGGKRRFAWFSLDRWDSDPVRFWTYVIEAFETVVPGVGAEARALLGPRTPVRESALPALVNSLEPVADCLVLVLEDYHLVESADVHEDLAFFLDHLPPGLRVVLATRSDPALPLERMRGRGELTEIRTVDLRFSEGEAATFLNSVLGLALSPDDVASLQERTEGWAAGLYLAALSLRGRDDPHAFIADFAGDDRHVVDYLSAEVLHGQPEDVRRFMLETSVLERLSGPLCDAVTEGIGSAAMLRRIEHANLFLVPLDNRREWYRYHHLFGRLLFHELEQSSGDLVPELHRRASAWYRENSGVPEAIHHVVASGDLEDAGGLVASHWSDFFNQGRLATVSSWLDQVGEPVVRADARLCGARAWLNLDLGRIEEVEHWIDTAERLVDHDGAGTVERADVAVLRAVYLFKKGDVGGATRVAAEMVEQVPAEATFPRTVAHLVLGIGLYWSGESARALALLERAVELARAAGNDLATSYGLGYLALSRVAENDLVKADGLAAEAIRLGEEKHFAEHFVMLIAHLAQARVKARHGKPAEADEAASRAVALALRGAGRVEVVAVQATLAELAHGLGRALEAKALIEGTRLVLAECPDPGEVRRELARAERRIGLAGRGPRKAPLGVPLTGRELQILELLDSSLSQREIGSRLFVSLNTVKTHTRGIFRKLDASNRDEAVERARALGIL